LHTASLLGRGQIVAIKGIGGYHLACAATDSEAVERLRERKFRKEKPFALMVRDLAEASRVVKLSDAHLDCLSDAARPIVLAPSKVQLPGIAADTDEFGIMLPYSPVHELLFHFGSPSPLVLTSANRSSEPIAFEDDDAVDRLGAIADAFLIGERPIARRVDDSVVAIRNGQPAVIRRARGYTPAVVAQLPCERPILALGADLKNSIALVVEGDVIVSQHIGDLGDLETNRSFECTAGDLLAMYGVRADEMIVAHDLHPEFFSTWFAERLDCHRRVAVQHHHAHIASVLAEQGDFDRPVVGIALDGTGYGEDGTIWGFEIFVGSVSRGLKRIRHLRPAPLPGGDAAARYPVQAAAGFLAGCSAPDLCDHPFSFPERYEQAKQLVNNNFRCFQTTSAGRLFDTVAALCGFTREVTYEGQAAIWLEHKSRTIEPGSTSMVPYPFPGLDHRPLLQRIIDDRVAGRPIAEISYAFHAALASSLSQAAAEVAREHATNQVVMSGGVFQNRLLRDLLASRFHPGSGIRIRFNQLVPSGDGGISLGQTAIAGLTAAG
jgi:hydrogenase maturation protein HypF